jgi:hypothetical protein
MSAPLAPVGPEMERRNRRLIAERLHWPTGTAEQCEQIEDQAPGWSLWWTDRSGWEWDRPGFYASRVQWHRYDDGPRWVYGATPDDVLKAIEDAGPLSRWAY